MAKKLNISYDSELIESISADFDLRTPNKEALRKLIFTLDGDYDSNIMQVLNLATGVGKTYLMAAFIEYLRQQGVGNVIIVTPSKIVQTKTVNNFMPGTSNYIAGAQIAPSIVTPQDYSAWVTMTNGEPRLSYGKEVPMLLFIFNIQQLIAPNDYDGDTRGDSQDSIRRKPRKFDEHAGVLFDYLKNLDDLVVIADESHLYSTSAVAFNAALKELEPAVTIGLTASIMPGDNVIYSYPLYRAIQDQYVKSPVLAFRKGGYGSDSASEEQQLRDALQLRTLKQAYYDTYTMQNGLPHLNAVLFVVCSDVEHASQITSLLRSPEFLGGSNYVLQVDSQHDDDGIQRYLYNLDQPNSKTLAVVSVNKLKEGWDVKNIAVVVTLRAMASEVLTQQTMGRGLRLPFGKYTNVRQIDQLDIIAHQSFKELLEAENVLSQFGLDEAVNQDDKDKVLENIRKIARNNSDNRKNTNIPDLSNDNCKHENRQDINNSTFVDYSASGNDASTIGIRMIDERGGEDKEEQYPIVIKRNPRFQNVSYKFPVTNINMEQPTIDLTEIENKTIEEAAKRVTSTGEVMFRKEIVAAVGKKLRVVDTENAEVDSIQIDSEDAAKALVKLVLNMQLVPSTKEVARYVKDYMVRRFMQNVNFDKWTVKSLDSARDQLQSIIKDYIDGVKRSTKEVPIICPKEIVLGDHYLNEEKVYEPIDSRDQFVKGRYYSGWFNSLYEIESFDSYSGEYELARLLDTSPHIKWWHRLHSYYQAYIYYTAKDRYFPDFVAFDDEGTYWIIEGKSESGRDDDQVQAKRLAAEKIVRKMAVEKEYSGQTWGYLIAYEEDIAKADSWNDLKTFAQPISNAV